MSRSSSPAPADGDRVYVLGAGRMGLALGEALLGAGTASSLCYASRSAVPPQTPLFSDPRVSYQEGVTAPLPDTTVVLLAVPDDGLRSAARALSAFPRPRGCVALHLSGALTASVLEPLREMGYPTGSLHPLQTVADPAAGASRLRGCAFAIGGDAEAMEAARRLVGRLADQVLVVPPHVRPAYHAAAVIASNYLVALLDLAARQLDGLGLDERERVRALLPLVRGTLDNVEELGLARALTGPIARGDVDTVRLHLTRLSAEDRPVYCALGREALRVALRSGLDADRAHEIAALLSEIP
ncbi:MAG: Rossmann-like and DUF2520 domain-containing protein [Gemmatimonadota bacterium]